MLGVLFYRLKIMYSGLGVKILCLAIMVSVTFLIAGLYNNAQDSSKLKVGVTFEEVTPLTEEIMASLRNNEIIYPTVMSYDEGLKAVEENRVQALFLFPVDLEAKIEAQDYEGMVKVYFLDENYLPYILMDIVGSELIGEIALETVFRFYRGAAEEAGFEDQLTEAYMAGLYEAGKEAQKKEVDNFYIRKTYINDQNLTIKDVTLDNALVLRQIIYGVIYVFYGFYLLFLGVNLVRERQSGTGRRWLSLGIGGLETGIMELLCLIIGALPISLVMTLVEGWFDGHYLFYLLVNLSFSLAYGGLVYAFSSLFRQVTTFVLIGTALVLLIGIVSGSFFVLDSGNAMTTVLTSMTPVYHLIQSLNALVVEGKSRPASSFVLYMCSYGLGMSLVAILIQKLRYRLNPGT